MKKLVKLSKTQQNRVRHMSTKNLLILIIAILIGVIAVLALNQEEPTQLENLASDLSEAGEEISDEIDDHTTERE